MSTVANPAYLPDDLPVPVDNGACDHLPGMAVPPVPLWTTSGDTVDLSVLPGRTVVYAYPRTRPPGEDAPQDWDLIPGARGCTPEACGFRDHHGELQALGAEVFGLSTQPTPFQQEVRERLGLPFPLLSDEALQLTRALRLPEFSYNGETLIARLTLVIRDGIVEHVFYPVFPPDGHAEAVVAWLSGTPDRMGRRASPSSE